MQLWLIEPQTVMVRGGQAAPPLPPGQAAPPLPPGPQGSHKRRGGKALSKNGYGYIYIYIYIYKSEISREANLLGLGLLGSTAPTRVAVVQGVVV